MALSQSLIDQFVKLTTVEKEDKEVTVNGTYKKINNVEYVRIDGSDIWTPVNSMVEAEDGERVKVLIKNHAATITGNITSPSARNKSVESLKDEVDEQGNTIKQMDNTIIQQGNSIIQLDTNIKQVDSNIQQIDATISQHNVAIQQIDTTIKEQGDSIVSMNNEITQQGNKITSLNNTVESQGNTIVEHDDKIVSMNNSIVSQGNEISAHGNKIDQLDNNIEQQGNSITEINNKIVQQDNVINQQGNTIEQHNNSIIQQNNNIVMLNSAFQIIDGKLVGLNEAIIDELKTDHLDSNYATIDFANINTAAVEKLFTESGIIKDLVVKEGHITGELVGVTIKGDLIEGNTIRADKLVVKGEDGVYYKLNLDGINNISTSQSSKFDIVTTKPDDWDINYKNYYVINNDIYTHVIGSTAPVWSANKYYRLNSSYESGLDGTVIVAHSITADKVSVNDLVAFGATIGGFDITDHSIYSHGKNTINSTARGIYMDDDGQIVFGDANNFIKYFKDTDNEYKIMLCADKIYTGSNSKSIAEQIKDTQKEIEKAKEEMTTFLQIESSKGTVFKNDQVSTLLSVTIYRGSDRITDMTTLRSLMGNDVYLQWSWKRLNDEEYGVISASDSRIGHDGFTFTLSPEDVDTKVTFLCELMN